MLLPIISIVGPDVVALHTQTLFLQTITLRINP